MSFISRIIATMVGSAVLVWLFAASIFGQTTSNTVEIVEVYSQSQEFYLKSIPYDNHSPTLRGKTYVYKASDKKPIYEFDRGFDLPAFGNSFLFISDDGETIFSVIGNVDDEDSEGLRSVVVYKRGKIVKSHTMVEVTGCDVKTDRCDLVYYNSKIPDEEKKGNEKERFLADFPVFQHDGTVYITDSKKNTHLFDLTTGERLRSVPFSQIFDEIKNKASKDTIYRQPLAAPPWYQLPTLIDGKDTVKALAEFLGMKPHDNGVPADRQYRGYTIKLSFYLRQDGSIEFESVYADSELPKDKIIEFFTTNRFKVINIPEVFPKWFIGDNYIFLRKADERIARKERQQQKVREAEELKKRLIAEKIDGVYIPKDLRDCFLELDKILKDVDKAEIRALPKRDDMIEYHFGLGMWMRNNWGLWGGSRLQKYFTDKGIRHPDDMSSVVLFYYFDWLTGKQDTWKDFEKNPGSPFDK